MRMMMMMTTTTKSTMMMVQKLVSYPEFKVEIFVCYLQEAHNAYAGIEIP